MENQSGTTLCWSWLLNLERWYSLALIIWTPLFPAIGLDNQGFQIINYRGTGLEKQRGKKRKLFAASRLDWCRIWFIGVQIIKARLYSPLILFDRLSMPAVQRCSKPSFQTADVWTFWRGAVTPLISTGPELSTKPFWLSSRNLLIERPRRKNWTDCKWLKYLYPQPFNMYFLWERWGGALS